MQRIDSVKDLIRMLRSGPYTSVGSYPLQYIAHDGSQYSPGYVRANVWEFARAVKNAQNPRDYVDCSLVIQWVGVLWENPDNTECAGTGERLEAAYN